MRARDAHDGSRSPHIAAADVGATHVVVLSPAGARGAPYRGARRRGDPRGRPISCVEVAHDGAMVAHDGAPLQPVAVG